jgi:uncharacterized membrane protein
MRLHGVMIGVGTLGLAAAAGAQPFDFQGLGLADGMLELRVTGMCSSGKQLVYKAVNEKGVQVVESPGHWVDGEFFPMPDQFDENGDYIDSESMQFRARPDRGQHIPGIDVVVRKIPPNKPGVWDTNDGHPGFVQELDNPWGYAGEAHSLNTDGSIIAGSVFYDVLGDGIERPQAVQWLNRGSAEMLAMPDGYNSSEARGVSLSGELIVGYAAINEQGQPSDAPTKKKAAYWAGGHVNIIDPDSEEISAFTGISDDGSMGIGYVAIKEKGGGPKSAMAYQFWDGALTMLHEGDYDGDGIADGSAAYALSTDGSVIGGSITQIANLETATLWKKGVLGTYTEYNVMELLANIGSSGQDGWYLHAVTGVSGDGRTIAGWGTDPLGQTQGWVAHIPAPGSVALIGLAGLVAARRRRA